jgi:hypothetical protein
LAACSAGSNREGLCQQLAVAKKFARLFGVAGCKGFKPIAGTVGRTNNPRAGVRAGGAATAPNISTSHADAVRAALRAQGWMPGQDVTVFSDGNQHSKAP